MSEEIPSHYSRYSRWITKSKLKRNTFQKPILTGIILTLIAMGFRLIDIFVLRLDERLGEIILFNNK